MIEKVAFTMYPAVNLERARNFYENTFGLKLSKVSGSGHWIEYDLPGGGCFCITDMVPGLKPNADAGGVAFEVADIEKFATQLKSKGVKFKAEVFPTPVCKIAVILDSEGNAVSLHQLHNKKTND